MADEQNEAKDFDSVSDKLLNDMEKETPAGSSPDNKQGDDSNLTAKAATAEVEKTEKVKEVESDSSLSVDEKLAKIKEILGEDEKAIDAYIKAKGFHKDPAWQKQRELIEKLKKEGQSSSISAEDKAALDEFKKLRASPEYIQQNMKAQGYTQEAIDKKLRESGINVPEKPQDDVNLVVDKLGLKLDGMSSDEKTNILANISDVAKIANILINDRLGKILPEKLAPIQDHISSISQKEHSSKMVTIMKDTVKTENILDFDKDIEPELNKFMDANPDATQLDVMEQFKLLNHRLSVERLRTGKRKDERDDKRTNLRQNTPISGNSNIPKKTGNFDADADAFLDTLNV